MLDAGVEASVEAYLEFSATRRAGPPAAAQGEEDARPERATWDALQVQGDARETFLEGPHLAAGLDEAAGVAGAEARRGVARASDSSSSSSTATVPRGAAAAAGSTSGGDDWADDDDSGFAVVPVTAEEFARLGGDLVPRTDVARRVGNGRVFLTFHSSKLL